MFFRSNHCYSFYFHFLDMLGCWCHEKYFLSSTLQLHSEDAGIVTSVWLCQAEDTNNTDDDSQEIHLANSLKELFKFKNNVLIFARFLQIFSRKNLQEPEGLWLSNNISQHQQMEEIQVEEQELEVFDERHDLIDEASAHLKDEQHCLVFICSDKTIVPHQIGFQRLSVEDTMSSHQPSLWTSPEKVIEMNGHIVGIALSPNQQELLVNVRSWPENCVISNMEPPCISNQIELKTICLTTLSIIPNKTYSGHQGFTASEEAFYLYLDVSDNFVGSGSEDHFGNIWDRHYGCRVGKLAHDACVNAVAFHPVTEAVAATASDDFTIKLWRTAESIPVMMNNLVE